MSDSVIIEGGCWPYKYENSNVWVYEYEDTEGDHFLVFYSDTKPKIGDTIVNGVLVPLVGYKINNDPGFQVKHK